VRLSLKLFYLRKALCALCLLLAVVATVSVLYLLGPLAHTVLEVLLLGLLAVVLFTVMGGFEVLRMWLSLKNTFEPDGVQEA